MQKRIQSWPVNCLHSYRKTSAYFWISKVWPDQPFFKTSLTVCADMLTTLKAIFWIFQPRCQCKLSFSMDTNFTACVWISLMVYLHHNKNNETKYAPSSLRRSMSFHSISWTEFPGFINPINMKPTKLLESKHQQQLYRRTNSRSWIQSK